MEKAIPLRRTPSAKLNPLEKVSSNKILHSCFLPFVYLTKFLGIFPVQINPNGSIVFKWWSLPTFYSFLYVGFFGTVTALFVPYFYKITKVLRRDTLDLISQLVFSIGQFIAALVSLFLVPYMIRRIVIFWNELSPIIEALVSESAEVIKIFHRVYKFSRLIVGGWLLYTILYCAFAWWYFDKYRSNYFGDNILESSYFMGLYIAFNIINSTNILHSMTFVFFASSLRHSFRSLDYIVVEKLLNKYTVLADARDASSKLWYKCFNMYESLTKLTVLLGEIYGTYLITQILAMLTGTLTNIYFLITIKKFDLASHGASVSATGVYILWLFIICNTGEKLFQFDNSCRKALLKTSVLHKENHQVSSLLMEEAKYVTASNYFSLNRQLITAILGNVLTYLVVLIQLNLTSRCS